MDASELVQGSQEWIAARVGSVGASRVADVIAKTKSGWGASRANYAAELIAERLTGVPADRFISDAMRHGTETEAEARAAYAFYADVDVQEIGLVRHPTIVGAHASPDGLVGAVGLVEIKCPATATHIETLLSGKVAQKYITQTQFQMACTGRTFCDFVSYDPRLPETMRLFVHRVERDEDLIASLERDVSDFLAEVAEKVEALRARYEPEALAA